MVRQPCNVWPEALPAHPLNKSMAKCPEFQSCNFHEASRSARDASSTMCYVTLSSLPESFTSNLHSEILATLTLTKCCFGLELLNSNTLHQNMVSIAGNLTPSLSNSNARNFSSLCCDWGRAAGKSCAAAVLADGILVANNDPDSADADILSCGSLCVIDNGL